MDTVSRLQAPPPLPASFTEPGRPWASTLFLTYACALTFGPGALSYLLLVHGGVHWLALAVPIAVLSGVAGFGFYVMGTTAHEGFHFTLARNKFLSAALGTWFSAAILAFSGVGFHLVHARHHRDTNGDHDPDYQLFSRFNSTWRRLLVLRFVNNRVYIKLVARLLIRYQLPHDLVSAFKPTELRRLAWLNVVAQMFWIVLYATAFSVEWQLGLCMVLLPHVATAVNQRCNRVRAARRHRRRSVKQCPFAHLALGHRTHGGHQLPPGTPPVPQGSMLAIAPCPHLVGRYAMGSAAPAADRARFLARLRTLPGALPLRPAAQPRPAGLKRPLPIHPRREGEVRPSALRA